MISNLYIRSIKINKQYQEGSYVFQLPVVKNFKPIEFKSNVTFFIGENGCGKSTLLEAIAVCLGFNAEGGSKNFCFSTKETHSPLFEYLKISKGIKTPKDGYFLRAESFYNVASQIDELDSIPAAAPPISNSYGGKSLHVQSRGESFMSLVTNRFNGNGLYILDEPEAALSPSRQLALLSLINELVNLNSQLIIATHSPILLAYPNADIYVINETGISLTPYKETEHYLLTKQFLNNPERMLDHLLD